MVILHVSDIHYDLDMINKISDMYYDVLCVTGDLLDDETSSYPVGLQLKVLKKFFKKVKKPLFICSGNHDLDGKWLTKIKKAVTDDGIEEVKKIKFGCAPFGCKDFSPFKKCDVLLTHVPPFGSLTAYDMKTSRDLGDKYLTKALEKKIIKPNFILCGHIHHPKENYEVFLGTNVLNAACKLYDFVYKK